MTEQITGAQFQESDGVEGWRVLVEGACTFFRTGSFAAGARLVEAISKLVSPEDHHLDIDLQYAGVIVRLIMVTDDYYGMSKRDLDLARQIKAVAHEDGLLYRPLCGADRTGFDRRARHSRGATFLACRTRLQGPWL